MPKEEALYVIDMIKKEVKDHRKSEHNAALQIIEKHVPNLDFHDPVDDLLEKLDKSINYALSISKKRRN